MARKARPNDPCPCGSGLKFKKCCNAGTSRDAAVVDRYSDADRKSVLLKLYAFIDDHLASQEEDADDLFWGAFSDREDELPEQWSAYSADAETAWFMFDHELDDGSRPVDVMIARGRLTAGERTFLKAMRATRMRPYELVDLVPGVSVTLREVLDGSVIEVRERTLSRTGSRGQNLAARVVAIGPTGMPEIEFGALPLAAPVQQFFDALRAGRDKILDGSVGSTPDDAYRELAVAFHDEFVSSIIDPRVPELRNNDGETMTITRVSFDANDARAVTAALDGAAGEGVEEAGVKGKWMWVGPAKSSREPVTLANLTLAQDRLTAEANSVVRGERVRELIERLCGAAVRYRATSHEDMRQRVLDDVRASQHESRKRDDGPPEP
ncbi:MAG: SEC-C domain-containing protein, partial [Deltaproteobacteria bacterium]